MNETTPKTCATCALWVVMTAGMWPTANLGTCNRPLHSCTRHRESAACEAHVERERRVDGGR